MGITYFGRKGYSVRISTGATRVSRRVYSVSQSTFRGNYYKHATALWFTNISRLAHFIQSRSNWEWGQKKEVPCRMRMAAFEIYPFLPVVFPSKPWPMYTSSKGLSVTRIITTNIRVKRMARWLKGKIGQNTRVENPKSLRGMWWGVDTSNFYRFRKAERPAQRRVLASALQ